jgi:hypothetical protein
VQVLLETCAFENPDRYEGRFVLWDVGFSHLYVDAPVAVWQTTVEPVGPNGIPAAAKEFPGLSARAETAAEARGGNPGRVFPSRDSDFFVHARQVRHVVLYCFTAACAARVL